MAQGLERTSGGKGGATVAEVPAADRAGTAAGPAPARGGETRRVPPPPPRQRPAAPHPGRRTPPGPGAGAAAGGAGGPAGGGPGPGARPGAGGTGDRAGVQRPAGRLPAQCGRRGGRPRSRTRFRRPGRDERRGGGADRPADLLGQPDRADQPGAAAVGTGLLLRGPAAAERARRVRGPRHAGRPAGPPAGGRSPQPGADRAGAEDRPDHPAAVPAQGRARPAQLACGRVLPARPHRGRGLLRLHPAAGRPGHVRGRRRHRQGSARRPW